MEILNALTPSGFPLYMYVSAAPKYDFDSLYRSIDALETEVVNGEIVKVEPLEVIRSNVQEKEKVEVNTCTVRLRAQFSMFEWALTLILKQLHV